MLLLKLEDIDAAQVVLSEIQSTRHRCSTSHGLDHICELLEEEHLLMTDSFVCALLLIGGYLLYLHLFLILDLLNALLKFLSIKLDHLLVCVILFFFFNIYLVLSEARQVSRIVISIFVFVHVLEILLFEANFREVRA
jgi:hypothetical protein